MAGRWTDNQLFLTENCILRKARLRLGSNSQVKKLSDHYLTTAAIKGVTAKDFDEAAERVKNPYFYLFMNTVSTMLLMPFTSLRSCDAVLKEPNLYIDQPDAQLWFHIATQFEQPLKDSTLTGFSFQPILRHDTAPNLDFSNLNIQSDEVKDHYKFAVLCLKRFGVTDYIEKKWKNLVVCAEKMKSEKTPSEFTLFVEECDKRCTYELAFFAYYFKRAFEAGITDKMRLDWLIDAPKIQSVFAKFYPVSAAMSDKTVIDPIFIQRVPAEVDQHMVRDVYESIKAVKTGSVIEMPTVVPNRNGGYKRIIL